MNVPMLDLKKQFAGIKDEVMPAIEKVCQEQACCLGPAVKQFEKNAAQFCNADFAVAVSSGTDAILVSLMAAGIGRGDEVILPSFTFAATTGTVARLGAVPIFADINKRTFNIDPVKIDEKVTSKTKAIIPVHLFGQMADMMPIMDIASRHGLTVIEDAAQSIGASQDGYSSGTVGDYGCFSFYPTKNLGAFGDAGMITTCSSENDSICRMIRNHGQNKQYEYERIGGNFRMDGIQGAVLNVKLRHLKDWQKKRQANARLYDELLKDVEQIKLPFIESGNVSVYNQYTIKAEDRDQLKEFLQNSGIGCAVYYPAPLHKQKCFEYLNCSRESLPITEKVCRQVLSIPVSPELERQQLEYVVEKIRKFYGC
ncbi:DegT/DnrJ/EryC1/StrS family aminotransferase [Sedimentisphaera salicampi]|uniref:UDP-2-acetamido-2-deoxy-3-oxo-D-glucuronate aminotransferase n=1 Tax=Sedimentisphaera salicampi TaxID=1941349 RepID=A0A1W6LJR5_9BACT|nr:DegT/DnrJ/EryC1/StrS family aminotransferase [Sedimentisphaera salicampi]ARN55974.1 UDP-2-acetamido-2-deoxy-3-oxo-D-glucuronate aminotransferase [Sedimentisphaera salicampi]OXU15890.1 UDP-2-acetamido-2-deoxy-3-oxo-D-glucuronate aminotransferase [Sedimentisphaera salicampi]